jgi:hypothetical protein
MPQVKDGVEDVDRAYVLYIITTIFTAGTLITTTARIGTKLKCKLRLGIDDWLIMLGAVCKKQKMNNNKKKERANKT